MISKIKILSSWILLCFLLLMFGCAASPPDPESLDYRARAETLVDEDVKV